MEDTPAEDLLGELPGKSGDFPEAQENMAPSQRLTKFVSNL